MFRLHYDLDFLEEGEIWRPEIDNVRYENYEFSRQQFELTPKDMIMKIIPGGLLDLSRGYEDFTWATRLLAYPRLLTLKTTDMVIGQPPIINAQSKDKYTDIIRDIRASADLSNALRMALIDYSRFGVALLRVFKDSNGKAKVTTWDPTEWVPVFYPDGTNRIHYNVIGWVYKDKITIQIHDTEDGSYEERVCQYDGKVIGQKLSSKRYNKTSGKQLLYSIINTPTSTNPLGCNDYLIINSLLQKAIERLMAILRVLDEHADPSMTGPYSLLDKAENGELVFKTSKYYAVGKDEEKPEYLVWEANLDSSFKAFDELCKQIYILSEMGEAFLGAPQGSSNVVSGTAMRFKMISPLEKARRIQSNLTEPLKNIISSILSIEGHDLPAKEINILWKDSLPKDPREMAELTRLEAGTPSIKPLSQSLIDNYDLDKETADHYVQEALACQELFKSINQKPEEGNSTETLDKSNQDINNPNYPLKHGSQMDPATSENLGDDQRSAKA